MIIDPVSFSSNRNPTDNIWDAMYTQRAIRYWEDKKISRDVLLEVVRAASKAPSGSNTQPWVFVVVDEDKQRLAISAALRSVFESTDALQSIISHGENSDDKTERLMLKGAREFFSKLERAPAIIVPCLYRLSSPTQNPASLEAGSSIYLAVQNMLLSARALGLGTVMTTAHKLIEPTLRDILSIPDDAWPAALVPIGYPKANFGPTTRKPVENILAWNQFRC